MRKQKEQKEVKLRQRTVLRKLKCNHQNVIYNFSIENLHSFSIDPMTLSKYGGDDEKRRWSVTGNKNERDFDTFAMQLWSIHHHFNNGYVHL